MTLKMSNQRWTADRNIEFINEYQRHECLWDTKHPQYKHRESREGAYKEIMEAMQMESIKEVVSKIRTLRNTYNNEILKTKKRMATNDEYISKIPWLSHMDFLKSIESYNSENTKHEPLDITDGVLECNIEEYSISPTPIIRHKRKMRDPLFKSVDAVDNVSMHHYPSSQNDEFDLFGQTIAQQLRQLPLEVALETEELILSTVRRQRVRVLSLSSQREPSSSIMQCMEQKLYHRASSSED